MRSKKQRFAFQTFIETPTTAPSILRFGITHHPHEGGDGAKCGAKSAATPCVINLEVTGARSESKDYASLPTSTMAGPDRKRWICDDSTITPRVDKSAFNSAIYFS